MTERTQPGAEGRLFPSETWGHGFSLSLQADRMGYACSPRERFDRLEDYTTVEGVIYKHDLDVVDPFTLDMPPSVLAKFAPLDIACPSIGGGLTWSDVNEIREAIVRAASNPNAGVPPGRIGWSGRKVYHGTSLTSARDIAAFGVNVARSHGGYFGHAFYVAEDAELARSNYADFADEDDGSTVLEFVIADEAKILDMRNPADAALWSSSRASRLIGDRSMPAVAVREGIQGIYDRSVGGLAVFDGAVLGTPFNAPDISEAPSP